jgi:hypothetical protein
MFLRNVGCLSTDYTMLHPRITAVRISNPAGGIFIFSLISLVVKNESRLMRLPCCLCLPHQLLMPEPIIMKPGTYITAPEPITTAYFTNPSHQSVCLYVYPSLIFARQRLGKHVPTATNTHKNRRIVRRVIFCTVFVLSKESLWVSVYPPPPHDLDVVGGLVPLRCEEGRPKAVRDKVAGKGQQQNY